MFDEVFLIIFLAIIAVAGVCNWVLIIISLFNKNNGEFWFARLTHSPSTGRVFYLAKIIDKRNWVAYYLTIFIC